MSTTVNVHEAKSTLSKLLERAEAGETITIARAGRPVAQLVPLPRTDIVFGGMKGEIHYDEASWDAVDDEIRGMFDEGVGPR